MLVAALVGGNTVLAILLIVVCLFSGVYLMAVSSAFMIFFITTMLALLYGLLGEFSIGLLLTRLAETAAGAVIGIGVAYAVLPTSTRDVARQRVRDVLDALATVGRAGGRTGREGRRRGHRRLPASADETARLRHALDALRTAARPITHGFAGVADRAGSRRTLRLLGACVHHGTALLRLADTAPGAAADPGAASRVRGRGGRRAGGLGRRSPPASTAASAAARSPLRRPCSTRSRRAPRSRRRAGTRSSPPRSATSCGAQPGALSKRASELGATLADRAPAPADAH